MLNGIIYSLLMLECLAREINLHLVALVAIDQRKESGEFSVINKAFKSNLYDLIRLRDYS